MRRNQCANRDLWHRIVKAVFASYRDAKALVFGLEFCATVLAFCGDGGHSSEIKYIRDLSNDDGLVA